MNTSDSNEETQHSTGEAYKPRTQSDSNRQRRPRLHIDLDIDDTGPGLEAELRATSEAARERTRGLIAMILVALLVLIVAGGFALAATGFEVGVIEKLFGLAFTPLLALTSGVCGYYFGAHSRRA